MVRRLINLSERHDSMEILQKTREFYWARVEYFGKFISLQKYLGVSLSMTLFWIRLCLIGCILDIIFFFWVIWNISLFNHESIYKKAAIRHGKYISHGSQNSTKEDEENESKTKGKDHCHV